MSTSTLVRRAHAITATPARPRTARRRPVRALRRPIRRSGRSVTTSSSTWWFVAAAAIVLALMTGTGALTPATTVPASPAGAAAPYTGGSTGCVIDDPTTTGCVTAATAHALAEIDRAFGSYRQGPTILSAGCWDAHAWNPTSDHPKGRACDLFIGKAGTFPTGAALDHGWALANWLRANAAALRVRYVIWQGRIWQADTNRDTGGWGTKYTGGGIYDPTDATGGHYDHIHVSIEI